MQRALREAAKRVHHARKLAASGACSAFNVPRAFTNAFASTASSGRTDLQHSVLQDLPARLRGALHASHLEAAVAEVAQQQARRVSAALRQMEAAKARVAALQKRLTWERAEALLAARLAPQFCSMLSVSNTGQRLMLVGVPLSVGCYLSMDPAHCYSSTAAVPHYMQRHKDRHALLRAVDAVAEELALMFRAIYLLLLFMPVAATAPVCVGLDLGRQQWQLLLRWTLEHAGAAFIKWGQWAATRPDMFPTDLCEVLSSLQTAAPQHKFKHTRRTIEAAFRQPLEEIFDEFGKQPVASGSIAQIHKAKLSARGSARTGCPAGTVVAVKVRHPGVSVTMQRDFALMQRAAVLSSRLPILSDLNLQESVRQFGAPLREQLDLHTEARNLERFNRNFRNWSKLSFPAPIFPLVAPDVLVESFEEGDLITTYVNDPQNPHNVALANIGLESYLKMLLQDNLIHADLHPGNILVRVQEQKAGGWWLYIKERLNLLSQEHMVLLDVGMVAELTRQDQLYLVDFFKAISSKDGHALGKNILKFADGQTCPKPEKFVDDMTKLFESLSWDQIRHDTSGVIQEMMEMIRQHQVNLRGVVSTVVVTTLVLEGWSSKLNPGINILEKLRSLLPLTWAERVENYITAFGSDRQILPAGEY